MPRLFLAIWPDDAAAKRLSSLAADAAKRTGGRAVPGANIHLTLAFLGDVPEARVPEIEAIARSVTAPTFQVSLDELGSFRKAKVAWIGCSTVPAVLACLERDLTQGLRAAGFALDDRPYAPHVTLVRKIDRRLGPETAEAIEWRASAFELVRTEFGKGSYSRLAAYSLR